MYLLSIFKQKIHKSTQEHTKVKNIFDCYKTFNILSTNTMKTVNFIYWKCNVLFINQIITLTLKVFIEICYENLAFERIFKMHTHCSEILKDYVPTPGLKPANNWLLARCPRRPKPLIYSHFRFIWWEININILHWKLPLKFVEIADKSFNSNLYKPCK